MTVLTTERLILRPVARDDLSEILALAGDVAVAEMTGSIPYPLTGEDVEAWFESCARDGEHTFAIERAADHKLVGAVALTLGQDDEPNTLGYWIGRPYWGQGYATEAARRILRFAFGELKLGSIEAGVFPDNAASMRVLTKVGFHEIGHAQRPAPARGGDREVVLFVATRASFAQAALSQAVGRE